ncbi:MAG: hypothetical protein QF464_19670, partial [Myxococcota bacterium]|nr:hypothetical protein [Myxococcota bacterium]
MSTPSVNGSGGAWLRRIGAPGTRALVPLLVAWSSVGCPLSPSSPTDLDAYTRAPETVDSAETVDRDVEVLSRQEVSKPVEWTLPVYELSVDPDDFARLFDDVQADVSVPASLMALGASYDIELELHGQSSRKFPKTNFKFKFPDEGLF